MAITSITIMITITTLENKDDHNDDVIKKSTVMTLMTTTIT